jgi:ribonuclease BN (tRNA processing enzyme)
MTTATNDTEIRAWLLGSGGGFPSHRLTCCALIRRGDQALMIDAGTGVWGVFERRELLDGVDTINVILTHFHLDHLIGLSSFPNMSPRREVKIWGPGRALYYTDTRTILERMLTGPFLAKGWDLTAIAAQIGEIREGNFSLAGFHISARTQLLHSDPTVAFRIEDRMCYCTDTALDLANIRFAAGCPTLVHEAWYTGPTPDGRATHSSAAEAGRMARESGASNLVLIHVNPCGDTVALGAEARTIFPAAVVGEDMMEIPM